MMEETDTKFRKFPKVNGREVVQSPQGREESGIKEECEAGKREFYYTEER